MRKFVIGQCERNCMTVQVVDMLVLSHISDNCDVSRR